jgi:flagellar biosynthesis protein FlhG
MVSRRDQASGLRQLFGAQSAQVVAFISGGNSCGRTSLLVQTSTALARSGQGVVLVDENPGPENALAAYGVKARRDLIDLIDGGCAAYQVAVEAAPGLRVVSAVRVATELQHLDEVTRQRLDEGLLELQEDARFVLLDCALRRGGHLSPLALAARHMVLVVAAEPAAITDAYALIKRLVKERGPAGFHVVITRARGETESFAIFENLRRTAQEHLGVRLDFLGGVPVPSSANLADALQNRLPHQSATPRPPANVQREPLLPVTRGTRVRVSRLDSVL